MRNTPKKPRIVAIVQARLGSSRLPLKSLLCLRGLPIVDWVWQRLKRSRELDDVVFAIPDTPLDMVLAEHLERNGMAFVRGDEDDVLERFQVAASFSGADHVVRVCADNPFISPEAVDSLIRFFKENNPDYAYNHIPRDNLWPDGLGAEMVSRELLEYMGRKACAPSQREHCFNYIWDNPDKWRIATFDPKERWLQRPDLKLDIDSADDFRRLARLPVRPDMELEALIRACEVQKSS